MRWFLACLLLPAAWGCEGDDTTTSGSSATGGGGGASSCEALVWPAEATGARLFVATSGEMDAFVTGVALDVGAACRALAVELGAGPDDASHADPFFEAEVWCELAASEIGAAASPESLAARVQPPQCAFLAADAAACEIECGAVAGSCPTIDDLLARCASVSLTGACPGSCTGACEGSSLEAIPCEGTCAGACSGTCDAASIDGAGCAGICAGECTGSCQPAAGAACASDCTGGCSPGAAPTACRTPLFPPLDCDVPAGCSGKCRVRALATASCDEPGVGLTAGTTAPALVAALRERLPAVFEACDARVQHAQAAFTEMIHLGEIATPQMAGLGKDHVACISAAVDAVGAASQRMPPLGAGCSAISGAVIAP